MTDARQRAGRSTAEQYDMRELTHRMRLAADALLSNLSQAQLTKAQFKFSNESERRDWDFIPKYRPRGLALREMTDRQQALAQQLIASGLSVRGYSQAVAIMSFENVLRELASAHLGAVAGEFRHPGKYLFSFFGEPHAEQTWGWRVVGHHLSLNFTIVDGFYLAHTPLLFGSEPARFGAFAPLIEDEDRGFALLNTLNAEQKQRTVIHDVAPPDFVTRVVAKLGQEEWPADHELGFDDYVISEHDRQMLRWIRSEARGLPGTAMDAEQFEIFKRLIIGYVERLPAEAAAKHWDRLCGLGLEQFTFAWAGQLERGKPHYYRIQGPAFLIEFDNAQTGGGLPGAANHIHTVWRDPENDFGDDLLLHHYAQDHLPYVATRLQSSKPD